MHLYEKKLFTLGVLLFTVAANAQTGKVGINTTTPTEILDVKGTAKVQSLPTNGATNAIYNGAATTTGTFTATRTVVADANGVLGTVAGIPSSNNSITVLNTNGGTIAFPLPISGNLVGSNPYPSTLIVNNTSANTTATVTLPSATTYDGYKVTVCGGTQSSAGVAVVSPNSQYFGTNSTYYQFRGNYSLITTSSGSNTSKCVTMQAAGGAWYIVGQ